MGRFFQKHPLIATWLILSTIAAALYLGGHVVSRVSDPSVDGVQNAVRSTASDF